MSIEIELPRAYEPLLMPARRKVYYGGRGAARSWSFARTLIGKAYKKRIRVGCFREYQSSIGDSVHQTLCDQIDELGLSQHYRITDTEITSSVGSNFLFKGLRHHYTEIKSIEGIDIGWVEEAQAVSKDSWRVLLPTIRRPGSEIWVSMNTGEVDDATYVEFIKNPRPGDVVKLVTYRDNPYFPPELEEERLRMKDADPDAYEWIWEGQPRTISDAVIFKGRYVIDAFEDPGPEVVERYYYGVDHGFANDPAFVTRSYILGDELYVSHEAVGYHIELLDLPAFLDTIPGIQSGWRIWADSSRPETNSFLRGKGYPVESADKWPGSVEDGITHLKGFKKIHIHHRCVHLAQEARLYSYKVDKQSGTVLPIIKDKHNHGWDSLRYALGEYIKSRGPLGVWMKLGA